VGEPATVGFSPPTRRVDEDRHAAMFAGAVALPGRSSMNDQDVLERIRQLMEEEQKLRDAHSSGDRPVDATERERLQALEEALDQCWDLLRQRRAREEFGADPDAATARPKDTVEKYLQ